MNRSLLRQSALCAVLVLGVCVNLFAGDVPPPPPAPYLGPADINGDLALDAADFALFCQAWVQYHADGTADNRADLNKDGAIGYEDAVVFVTEWIKARL